jgi:hypothetical protein
VLAFKGGDTNTTRKEGDSMDRIFFEGLSAKELLAILNILWDLYDNDDDIYARFRDLLEIAEDVGRVRGVFR